MDVPVIDISPLIDGLGRQGGPDHAAVGVAGQIDHACRRVGFFSVVGHGVDEALLVELERLAREFFALAESEKAEIAMARGGRAWRGWFPVGGELTSGIPDRKEGLYLGTELAPEDPRVLAGVPLHGPNLFPRRPAALRHIVLDVIDALTRLGHQLVAAIGIGLGLGERWFDQHLTADPTVLLRIFHYPGGEPRRGDERSDHDGRRWGVGEHTDYGLLTLLRQDATGGLEVCSGNRWIDIEPVPGALVCNLGDMLERMTAGRYRATAHRVRVPGEDRISCPFFFDPGWDARVEELPLDGATAPADGHDRWDGTSLADLEGTYGEYLMSKVARVFPELGDEVL